jgi:anti-anti-sigma regulatory factor
MATTSVLNIDEQRIIAAFDEVGKELERSKGDTVLDFSAVRRIDASALGALAELAGAAEEKSIKIVLRGVNVDVYKVLKLVKLTSRFCFEN